MTGWCSGYSADVKRSAMFCQLVREFESHPVHFLILFQNFEKLSSQNRREFKSRLGPKDLLPYHIGA